MTRFNPENKASIKVSDLIPPIGKLSSQKEADEYLEAYVLFLWGKSIGVSLEDVQKSVLKNIAYLAGYYPDDDIHDNIWKYYKVYPSTPKDPSEAYKKGLADGASSTIFK